MSTRAADGTHWGGLHRPGASPTSRGYDLISLSTGNLKRSTDNLKGATGAETEKAMVPHSSILAWKIPWTEEPGGLQSMGSLRVRRD